MQAEREKERGRGGGRDDTNDQRGKSARLEEQAQPMQNRYERYRGVARFTMGPPRSLERVAFFELFRRGTPVTQNFASTPIVIGRRRVAIPDNSRTSVGDIAKDETFLIQSMLTPMVIVVIFNNACSYSLYNIMNNI